MAAFVGAQMMLAALILLVAPGTAMAVPSRPATAGLPRRGALVVGLKPVRDLLQLGV